MNAHINSNSNRPIGVFDSGVGGLTVVSELFNQLPNEQIIYFGDTGRFPYGIRSAEVIRRFSRQNVNFLLEQNVKFVVIACNTASAQALDFIKKIYNIPMIGVIEPGAKAAASYTKNGRIGVIGSEGTINSSSYTKALLKIDPKFKVYGLACPLFISLAENGYIDKKATYLIAEDYMRVMKQKKIDTLVLGCTHFPPFKKVLSEVLGKEVTLVDSAEETAKTVALMLTSLGLNSHSAKPKTHKFYVSDTPEKLKNTSRYFVAKPIKKVEKIFIDAY
jgi:glutamate racemase